MVRPEGPHRELTDTEGNEPILGTFTHGFWVGSEVEIIAGEWWGVGEVSTQPRPGIRGQLWHPDHPWTEDYLSPGAKRLLSLELPQKNIFHTARQSSGSIAGEHRKDLRDAVIGAPRERSSLNVNVTTPDGKPQGTETRPTSGLRR